MDMQIKLNAAKFSVSKCFLFILLRRANIAWLRFVLAIDPKGEKQKYRQCFHLTLAIYLTTALCMSNVRSNFSSPVTDIPNSAMILIEVTYSYADTTSLPSSHVCRESHRWKWLCKMVFSIYKRCCRHTTWNSIPNPPTDHSHLHSAWNYK